MELIRCTKTALRLCRLTTAIRYPAWVTAPPAFVFPPHTKKCVRSWFSSLISGDVGPRGVRSIEHFIVAVTGKHNTTPDIKNNRMTNGTLHQEELSIRENTACRMYNFSRRKACNWVGTLPPFPSEDASGGVVSNVRIRRNKYSGVLQSTVGTNNTNKY